MKLNVKEILKPALSLFIICAVSAALLSYFNGLTAAKIAENDVLTEQQNQAVVMPDAASFGTDKSSIELDGTTYEYATAYDTVNNIFGYVFTVTEQGYGGDVKVMTGVYANGTIAGVSAVSLDNETPGLGQNVKKDSFLSQFIGLSGKIGLNTSSSKSPLGSTVNGVTSATYSSTAVVDAVNTALALYNLIKGGEQ